MKIKQTTTILLLVLVNFASGFLRVCYYTNWSQYRPDGGKFTPDHVNPALCSHLIYAFAKLEGNTLTAYEWNDDPTGFSIGMYAKINNMKKQHPHLKTLLAVGGWNAGSVLFSNIARLAKSRQEFVNNTQHFLRGRNFDGLDIDWEYPTQRGGRPEDKQNFVLLLKDLASAFEHDAYHTGRPKLLLTAAVPAGKEHIASGFDIPNLARSLDFISVMTYDLHGSWESRTGHNSPLLPRANELGAETFMNTEWALNHWAKMGAPKYKLLVGLGLYGRSFKLANPLNNGIGALAVGAGRMGNFTKEDGFMAYYEVCKELSNGGVRVWNPEHKIPYMYKGDLWVGYDDEQSVREKVHWTKRNGFGGMMVWSLALDDFNGHMCNKGPYPLLTTINKEYKKTAQPKTIQFIDPTAGGSNALGGSVVNPIITLLKDPPLAQAFEHTQSGGHSHHVHSPPILTNLSGIDIQQLSSLPHINLLDHLPSGNALATLPKNISKPKVVRPSGTAVPSQMSLSDLISQLIHAPANHQNSGHHDHHIGVPNMPHVAVPTQLSINAAPSTPKLKTAPNGPFLNSAVSGPNLPARMPSVGVPGSTATLTDILGSGLLPATLPGGTMSVPNAGQDIRIVDSSHHNPAIGHLTALGNIGVIPAVGRLGGVGHINHRGRGPNMSFTSKSNNTSSSSSSTSSSQSNSRNVSFGGQDQPSGRLNLQDVLQSGRPNLPTSLLGTVDPLAGLSHGSSMPGDSILSVLDGGSIELPSGSVGTVIPISNNDNLAQILSSLGVQLPTSGSVLLPEQARSLTPDRVLDELTFGNLIQPRSSNIIPPVQQSRASNMFPPVLQSQPSNIISTAQQIPIASAERVLEELTLGNLFQPRTINSISPVQQTPFASSRAASLSLPSMQLPRAIQTPRTIQSNSFARTGINRPADTTIQRSTLSRPNTQQRRRISLADLRRLLERRRLIQALRRQSQPPNNRNRLADTSNDITRQTRLRRPVLSQQRLPEPAVSRQRFTEPAVSRQRFTEPAFGRQRFTEPAVSRQRFTEPLISQQRFTEPAVSRQRFTEPAVSRQRLTEPTVSRQRFTQPAVSRQRFTQPAGSRQRFTQPAVSRQQIQRLPSVSRSRLTQPQQSTNSLIRRSRPQSPRSRSGITLLNSGNLPARIQRLFTDSASSFVPSSRF